MEMSDNTKNKREELNTILTKILDEGDVGQRGWWLKSKIFKLRPKLPQPSIMIRAAANQAREDSRYLIPRVNLTRTQ